MLSEHPCAEWTYLQYEHDHPMVKEDRIDSYLTIDVQGIFINYFQEPVFRIIDYILVQLYPVLVDFKDFQTLGVDYVREYTLFPYFMDRKIRVHKSKINLKPLFTQTEEDFECLEIDIADVVV